ncbi:MAG: hypothetical protein AVDCRST_MAG73-3232, partial [uncultured Thermomicrobiales bacterium]
CWICSVRCGRWRLTGQCSTPRPTSSTRWPGRFIGCCPVRSSGWNTVPCRPSRCTWTC